MQVGTVAEVWRYPVKSLGGERLDEPVAVGPTGLDGDRLRAIVDDATGRALSAKRVARLFEASAQSLGADGHVRITGPGFDLSTAEHDDATIAAALSRWLGFPVHLTDRRPPPGFYDSRSSVHLVTTGSLGAWDARRFRPNLVVVGEGEDDWVGRHLTFGGVPGHVRKRTSRCVMTTLPQPGVAHDPEVLGILQATRDGDLGVYVDPAADGKIAAGDTIDLADVG